MRLKLPLPRALGLKGHWEATAVVVVVEEEEVVAAAGVGGAAWLHQQGTGCVRAVGTSFQRQQPQVGREAFWGGS